MRSFQRSPGALRLLAPALAGSAILLLAIPAVLPAEAQSPTPDAQVTAAAALLEAHRAFRSGRYDTVDELLAPLASGSADAGLLRARAAIARGRYDAAIGWLTPVATIARGGPAALELGLLLRSLGRRPEAERLLQAVIQRASSTDEGATGRAARAA